MARGMGRGMGLTGTVTVGADCRTRTCDPLITNQVLYQLS